MRHAACALVALTVVAGGVRCKVLAPTADDPVTSASAQQLSPVASAGGAQLADSDIGESWDEEMLGERLLVMLSALRRRRKRVKSAPPPLGETLQELLCVVEEVELNGAVSAVLTFHEMRLMLRRLGVAPANLAKHTKSKLVLEVTSMVQAGVLSNSPAAVLRKLGHGLPAFEWHRQVLAELRRKLEVLAELGLRMSEKPGATAREDPLPAEFRRSAGSILQTLQPSRRGKARALSQKAQEQALERLVATMRREGAAKCIVSFAELRFLVAHLAGPSAASCASKSQLIERLSSAMASRSEAVSFKNMSGDMLDVMRIRFKLELLSKLGVPLVVNTPSSARELTDGNLTDSAGLRIRRVIRRLRDEARGPRRARMADPHVGSPPAPGPAPESDAVFDLHEGLDDWSLDDWLDQELIACSGTPAYGGN